MGAVDRIQYFPHIPTSTMKQGVAWHGSPIIKMTDKPKKITHNWCKKHPFEG